VQATASGTLGRATLTYPCPCPCPCPCPRALRPQGHGLGPFDHPCPAPSAGPGLLAHQSCPDDPPAHQSCPDDPPARQSCPDDPPARQSYPDDRWQQPQPAAPLGHRCRPSHPHQHLRRHQHRTWPLHALHPPPLPPPPCLPSTPGPVSHRGLPPSTDPLGQGTRRDGQPPLPGTLGGNTALGPPQSSGTSCPRTDALR
jgi:hypothetical protein